MVSRGVASELLPGSENAGLSNRASKIMTKTMDMNAWTGSESASLKRVTGMFGCNDSKTILRIIEFPIFSECRSGLKAQNESKSQSCREAEVRCLLASVDNLLRLFSVQAVPKAMEGAISEQGRPGD
jgi:hypothetical protein